MPADPSSPIPPGLASLPVADPLRPTETPPDGPAESTIRRTLGRVDDQALAAAVGAWLCDRDRRHRQDQRAVAVDGKTLRGANSRPTAASSTCSPRWTTPPARYWPNAPSTAPRRSPWVRPLLDPLDLTGVVVTADALDTHAEAAEFLVIEKHAHYLFTVKANPPTLLACWAGLPWPDVPVLDRTRDRAHGRVELRTLKAVTITHVGFPYVAHVLRVTGKTRDLQATPAAGGRWSTSASSHC